MVQWGTPILSLAVLVLIWWAVTAVFSLPAYILPTPLKVLDSIIGTGPVLWTNLETTFLETIEGFIVAVIVGVAASLLIASSKVAERLIYPILVTTQAVPKVAVAPIFLAWFGLGSEPRIVIAGLLAVFPIIINTSVGLIGVDPGLLMLARSTGAKRHRVFWQVRLPAALPGFFAGLKLGIALAVVGAVVGEFVGGDTGLGYIVTYAQGNLNTSLAFAAIVLLSVLGVALFYIIDGIEKLFVHWS
ncbi:MAG: ABC transporter permease [Acidimicrobiales bacterium]